MKDKEKIKNRDKKALTEGVPIGGKRACRKVLYEPSEKRVSGQKSRRLQTRLSSAGVHEERKRITFFMREKVLET